MVVTYNVYSNKWKSLKYIQFKHWKIRYHFILSIQCSPLFNLSDNDTYVYTCTHLSQIKKGINQTLLHFSVPIQAYEEASTVIRNAMKKTQHENKHVYVCIHAIICMYICMFVSMNEIACIYTFRFSLTTYPGEISSSTALYPARFEVSDQKPSLLAATASMMMIVFSHNSPTRGEWLLQAPQHPLFSTLKSVWKMYVWNDGRSIWKL